MMCCPVCPIHNPVSFKIGIRAFPEERLRVCTPRCVRRVRKEVRELAEQQPDIDIDILRQQVARQYMTKGRQ